jgi:hypothetical protein
MEKSLDYNNHRNFESRDKVQDLLIGRFTSSAVLLTSQKGNVIAIIGLLIKDFPQRLFAKKDSPS